MFDKALIDTDRFMDLPIGTKALYFLLGMEADDEGFVSYKKVMRIHGGSEDDIKVLTAKGFTIQFPSGVVVITDWNKNNWLDSRRIKSTEYQKEKAQLQLLEDKTYSLSGGLATASLEENRVEENSIVEKKKKLSYGEFNNVSLSDDEFKKLLESIGEKNTEILIEELSAYMASKGKRYSSHYATILAWARRRVSDHQEKLQAKKRTIV